MAEYCVIESNSEPKVEVDSPIPPTKDTTAYEEMHQDHEQIDMLTSSEEAVEYQRKGLKPCDFVVLSNKRFHSNLAFFKP